METAKDLSQYHQPVTELFNYPATKDALEKYKLTPEEVQFFHKNGYLPGIKLLGENQVNQLLEELDELMKPSFPGRELFYEVHLNESADPDKVLFHALGAWRIKAGFHDLLWNPAFLMVASQLLGDKTVRFWHDQLFCKPAHHGGVVAWHQDYSYWTRTSPMQHLTCWVALDDATKENGCIHYVPGSHRWGLLDKPDLAGDMDGLSAYLTEEQKQEFKTVPVELKKGFATFHHPLMVHGSYENYSDHARRAFVLNVFADGTQSDTDEPLLEGVPAFSKGEQIKGQFFPLLFKK